MPSAAGEIVAAAAAAAPAVVEPAAVAADKVAVDRSDVAEEVETVVSPLGSCIDCRSSETYPFLPWNAVVGMKAG